MIARGVIGLGEIILSEKGLRHVEKSTWPLVALIAIVSIAMIACFSQWPWGTASPWEMVAAIGTVSATLTAVGIATQTERRLRIESLHQAVILKWLLARWAGSVKTGSSLLADNLEVLASTSPGKAFQPDAVHLMKMAAKMIEPTFMMGYTDRLHILGKESGDCANMISLAWALRGHLDDIAPYLDIARKDMTILRTCAKQANDLHLLSLNVIAGLDK